MLAALWSWLTRIEAYVLASSTVSFIVAGIVLIVGCLWWKCSRKKGKSICMLTYIQLDTGYKILSHLSFLKPLKSCGLTSRRVKMTEAMGP